MSLSASVAGSGQLSLSWIPISPSMSLHSSGVDEVRWTMSLMNLSSSLCAAMYFLRCMTSRYSAPANSSQPGVSEEDGSKAMILLTPGRPFIDLAIFSSLSRSFEKLRGLVYSKTRCIFTVATAHLLTLWKVIIISIIISRCTMQDCLFRK